MLDRNVLVFQLHVYESVYVFGDACVHVYWYIELEFEDLDFHGLVYMDGDQCVQGWGPVCLRLGTSVYKDGDQCVQGWGTSVYKAGDQCLQRWGPVCTRMGD